MLAAWTLLAGSLGGQQAVPGAPVYSAASIVHGATWKPGALAPNTLIYIFGKDLSDRTHLRTDDDVQGDSLPFRFPQAGINVLVSGLFASLEYVSPEQITAVIPPVFDGAGEIEVTVIRGALRGPKVRIAMQPAAPALFMLQENVALARPAASYDWVTAESPLAPGDKVRLYATGLGRTNPPLSYLQMPREEGEIGARKDFAVTLAGADIPAELVGYVGLMPGAPGLYEIRLQLPEDCPDNPEIRIRVGDWDSPEGVILPVRRPPAQPQ
jgi:uncharacterized protein (TIGR03437 family)